MAPRPDDADRAPDGDAPTRPERDDVTHPEQEGAGQEVSPTLGTPPPPPATAPSSRAAAPPAASTGPGTDGPAEPEAPVGHDAAPEEPGRPGPTDEAAAARDLGPTRDSLGDVDARFASIVAGLQAEARPRSWTPDSTSAEVDDAHFEPPDPGPVLGGDPLLTTAWVAVLALPVVLLLGVLVWNPLPGLVLQVCVVGFLVGLAVLLWRMPRHRDDDDPGAVV